MKKNILAIIAVMVFASSAFAAVSSPCGAYKKPAAPKEVCTPREDGYRRDVLDNRIPTQTDNSGKTDSSLLQATKDRETLISGKE